MARETFAIDLILFIALCILAAFAISLSGCSPFPLYYDVGTV